jgi:hypothetical protein
MKTHGKKIIVMAAGVVWMSGIFSQTIQAQNVLLNETGTSTLADTFGINTGPEALTISWAVVENNSGIYTYSYVVNNPLGDVILNNSGQPTSTPEIVDAFSVVFDTTVAGAYVPGTQTGGVGNQNNGTSGLFWSFTAVNPNTSSPILSFESELPPTMGNANAQDANPPSPWSSIPDGQQVPVPTEVPDPPTTALLTGTLLFLSIMRKKASLSR